MNLATGEFIRRFLLHVLPKGFHRIRHYGLLAGATREATTWPRPASCWPCACRSRNAEEADRHGCACHPVPVLRRAHDHHRDLRAGLANTNIAPDLLAVIGIDTS